MGGFTRAASVVGLICVSAGALGIDLSIASSAVNDTWHVAVDSIPGLEQGLNLPYENYIANDTEGLVTPNGLREISNIFSKDTGGLVMSTGGLV